MGAVAGQALGPRRELQDGAADHSVQSAISESYLPIGEFRRQILAARFPLETPHLVNVGEVCREIQTDTGLDWQHAMVLDTEFLVQRAHP